MPCRYGDFHPNLANARCLLFTCAFVLSGIGFVSLFLSYLVGNLPIDSLGIEIVARYSWEAWVSRMA